MEEYQGLDTEASLFLRPLDTAHFRGPNSTYHRRTALEVKGIDTLTRRVVIKRSALGVL